jgi:Tol biopolymer transport system component
MIRGATVLVMVILVGTSGVCRADIAFSGYTGDFWQIWVMEDDGSEQRQLTRDEHDKRLPVWIDRDRLLYETNRSELVLFDLRTAQATQLFPETGAINGCDVAGSAIVCARFRADARDLSELFVAGLETPPPRTITHDTAMFRNPQWLPDGRRVVYSLKDGLKPEAIALMDVETTAQEMVVEHPWEFLQPSATPNGQDILAVSNETGDYEIWVISLATKTRKRLTDVAGLDSQPRWMRHGILFVSTRSGELALWAMSHDGEHPRPLTAFPSKDPDWIDSP